MTNLKTPEAAAAIAYANERCPGMDACNVVWVMCADDYLAGYTAGAKAERERIWEAVSRWIIFRVGLYSGDVAEVKQLIFGGGDE